MDINDLVGSVTLEDIRCIERVGKLNLDGSTGLGGWEPGEWSTTLGLHVNPISWGRRIEAWFRMSVDHPSAELQAAYAVIYSRDDDSDIGQHVRKDFLERVAAMACLPYLREAIHHTATELRLGQILVPMIRLGDITIDLDDRESGDNE